MTALTLWRHPRTAQAAGRCIGRTDLPVDRRRAKRLAHRIRAHARRLHLPREVWTSPQARCREVGRCLRRFGFVHHVNADLCELDFGAWDGRPWQAVAPAELAAWEADFLQHAPGGGESLAALMRRVQRFVQRGEGAPRLVVGHAGWINALGCLAVGRTPGARDWPAALRHGAQCSFDGAELQAVLSARP